MTQTPTLIRKTKHEMSWEKLPPDFPLPDEPVDNIIQPLLAAVLREILELTRLITAEMIVATNLAICAKVDGKTVVKAPDWMYVPKIISSNQIRRSYTPNAEGELPLIVMEFLSETDGGEYSVNPNYPYGKWYFYEQLLQVPIYIIFEPESGRLEIYSKPKSFE
jgi:Uma2 family endonuclease